MKEKLETTFYLTFLITVLGLFLKLTSSFMIPFAVAMILYFLFSPMVDILEKRKFPRWVAMLIVAIIVFGLVVILGLLAYSSFDMIAQEIPRYSSKFEKAKEFFINLGEKYPMLKLEELVKNIDIRAISSFAVKTMGSFVKFVSELSLMLLFFFFMLIGKGNLEKKIDKVYSDYRASQFKNLYRETTKKIYRYLWTKTVVSLITGFNVWLILVIFGIDFAFVWGFLTFIFNYIPNIGSFIITIPPILLAAIKFGKLIPVLFLLLLLVLNQMIMGNVVEPRLMGRTLNLSPLLILFSLFFWGWLWGIVGMIISVPLLSIIKIILESFPQTEKIGKLMES